VSTRGTRPPAIGGGWPWLGHALELRRDPVGFLRRGRERFGDLFSFRLPGAPVTVFSGPAAHAAFFQAGEDQLSAREVYRFTVPIFGRGVVYDVTPQLMDEQMGFLFPALRDDRLRVYARVMQEEAESYFEEWGDEGETDLFGAMNELTVFIASRCLIGQEFRRRLSKEFAHLYRDLEAGINLLAFLNPYLPLPAFRRRDRARAATAGLIAGIIAERRAGAVAGEDFLQTLMDARYADGRPLSDDEITGLLLATVFAGQHTSAVMGAWTGILLLEHPRHLAAVLAEHAEVLGHGEDVTLESLRRLTVFERSMKEAERLHPPLIMLMRRVVRDLEFGGSVVEAGGLAMVSPALSHRLPEVFTDPDRYDPDRFGPGRAEDRRTKHALIGFGGGHHRCIGQYFAQEQIKVIWSVLLRRFELTLLTSGVRPDYSTFVVGPRLPCRIRYRRRRRFAIPVPEIAAAGGP
jgi:sterol 14alpha-demethylase